ncbi:MAG: cysteine synthase family protein [Massilia sp.]
MTENAFASSKPRQVCSSIMEAIGHTPVVALNRLFSSHPDVEVVAKLEYMNPGGSIKDRMVKYMLAHQHKKRFTEQVVESSSGNTGASLAMASAVYGIDCEITVPDTTSHEKIKRIAAYGAKVHLCEADLAVADAGSYHSKAQSIARETGAFHLDQYRSKLNSEAHYTGIAPELWEQTAGQIDYFVCGIGTGGTISGVGRFLKERNPRIVVIGVEPLGSAYRSALQGRQGGHAFRSRIEGVGKREPAASFDASSVDEVIQVSDEDALEYCQRLAQTEGMLVGGSSGCVTAGIASILGEIKSGRVATIFPDSGVFYLSKYF